MEIFTNSLFPFIAEGSLDGQTKQLIEEARKSIALAEKELNYAEIAFGQAEKEPENPNLKLAEIAKWHYAQTMKYYGEAVTVLELTAKKNLPEKYKKYVELKTKKCLGQMAYTNTRQIVLEAVWQNPALEQ
jgi:hypothetical protein